MNLRDFQLSSRAVIPLALAIPIAREPLDLRVQQEREQKAQQELEKKGETGKEVFMICTTAMSSEDPAVDWL